jgi:hypothetical protein
MMVVRRLGRCYAVRGDLSGRQRQVGSRNHAPQLVGPRRRRSSLKRPPQAAPWAPLVVTPSCLLLQVVIIKNYSLLNNR